MPTPIKIEPPRVCINLDRDAVLGARTTNKIAGVDASSVAALLREFAQRSALRADNPFRAKAYGRAADNLLTLTLPLEQLIAEDRLRDIPGVGAVIADIVKKLQATGTHPALEKMRQEMPVGVLEMISVPGLRPDKVVQLYRELGLGSLAELEQARSRVWPRQR